MSTSNLHDSNTFTLRNVRHLPQHGMSLDSVGTGVALRELSSPADALYVWLPRLLQTRGRISEELRQFSSIEELLQYAEREKLEAAEKKRFETYKPLLVDFLAMWNKRGDFRKRAMTDLGGALLRIWGVRPPPIVTCQKGEYFHESKKEPRIILGQFIAARNAIWFNSDRIDGADPFDEVNTVAHEVRHALQYQHSQRSTDAKARKYQWEFAHPIDPDVDYEGYRNQLIEREARLSGESLEKDLEAVSAHP